jgi:sugar phosphate isomerase/epimerase
MISRKAFLKQTSLLLSATLLAQSNLYASLTGERKIKSVGLQLWSLAKLLEKDASGTLKMLSKQGYKEVELYGPYPFSTEKDQLSWKNIIPLVGFSKSGYYGFSVKEFSSILKDNGMSSPSMHVGLDTLRHNLEGVAEAAHILGQQYAGIAAIPDEERKNLDGYKRIADEFNTIGEKARKLGIRFLYHNHGYGFKEMEGSIPYDILIERTDPDLVFLEMDVYWTIAAGADPVKLLDKNKGRYKLMHVKDMTQRIAFSGDGGNPSQWIELFPYITDAGSGILDFKTIISHALSSGVDHFILENDAMANPSVSLKNGYQFMSKLDL